MIVLSYMVKGCPKMGKYFLCTPSSAFYILVSLALEVKS